MDTKWNTNEYSIQICITNEKQREIMSIINHVRLHKKVYLVSELLGLKGKILIRCFYNKEDMSDFK